MARRFAKVIEDEIQEAFFYPSDLVNTKTTIPLGFGEERWIYTSTLRVSVYIHHYSPPLRGIVVYYTDKRRKGQNPGYYWYRTFLTASIIELIGYLNIVPYSNPENKTIRFRNFHII